MRKNLVGSTALAIVLAVATQAEAGELPQGPYLSAFGGANWVDDVGGTFFEDPGIEIPYDSDTDVGYMAGGALGYRSGPAGPGQVRGEVEAAYRHNEEGLISSVGLSSSLRGHVTALSVMANAWYDIAFGNPWSFFIGGGLGGTRVSVDDIVPGIGPFVDDSDIVFAYQAGAGIAVTLPFGAELTVEYRYFATDNPEFEPVAAFVGAGLTRIESEYSAHSAMVGFRVPLK